MATVADLASYFDLPVELLDRHVILPLAEHYGGSRFAWDVHVPTQYGQLLAITDGVNFFGRDLWDQFRLWGSSDFDAHIMTRSHQIGVFPIFGDIPHLTSIKLDDGSIVATDWEVEGDVANGWLSRVADSLRAYVLTTIAVRHAYGYDPDGMPSDWWRPYAARGARYDMVDE